MNHIAKKAVILSRVSSVNQEDGKSPEGQIFNAQEYCKRKNLFVLDTFKITESSTVGKRKKFQAMISFVKSQKEPIAIISDTVDRFQRSFKETISLDPLRKEGKIELHFVSNGLVLHKDSPASDITMWNMCVLMAESYVLQLSENTKRGLNQKIRDGEFPTKAPIGYDNVELEGKKTIIIDPKSGPIIMKMFELYSTNNYSIEYMVAMLKEQGIKSERGTYYSKHSIGEALSNPFYYGVMRIKGKEYPHKHEPLITKELFDLCQAVKEDRVKQPVKYGSKEYVFRGLIKCKDCGTIISPYTRTKKTKVKAHSWTYLRCCKHQAKKNGTVCNALELREEKALAQMEEALEKLKVAPVVLESTLNRLNNFTLDDIAFKEQVERTNKQRLSQIDTERKSIFTMHSAGHITQEFMNERLKTLKEEEESLKLRLENKSDEAKTAAYNLERVLKLVNKLPELFRGSNLREKNAILNFTLSNLQLNGDKIDFTYTKPFSFIAEGYLCNVMGG